MKIDSDKLIARYGAVTLIAEAANSLFGDGSYLQSEKFQ